MFQPILPVSLQTFVIKGPGEQIYYPQIIHLQNITAQQTMNQKIYQQLQNLRREQYESQQADFFQEMLGQYEVKTNERNVLSLSLTNYAYAPYHAHGLTLMKSLTFAVKTGKNYQLHELFKPNSQYQDVLKKIIERQIKERNLDTFDEPITISSNQDFYIADKALVIYFQLYEITPYYVGFPMFPISIYEIQDIILEDGPLGKMLESG
ncbi:hypothetical protein HNQ35_001992 [Cerasibacillus quisquiliarum]|uniref:DUF3298 domain-containing protein n=1 Tax=Cerasibacillus quisquiliarum TaxID=227865 RepID=A0A511UY80_9BACI|nr:DUF3298 and DUF4163 domain-containing protein [Cerasibacillus quisquiliarum]MBB5146782.1 hypothetical protein [Cerasibacillus quisquiliarum]GEN31580.1 hypothetical protein CQU01_18180 [Cerasibacillus quisquiliarum]